MDVNTTLEKIKELVKKGNVSHIVVKRKDEQVLNLPVNVGLVGAAVGLTYAKWIMLAGVLATIGFGCTVDIIKSDGSTVKLLDDERNKKVKDFAAETVEKVKENIPVSISVDVKHDDEDSVPEVIGEDICNSEENEKK